MAFPTGITGRQRSVTQSCPPVSEHSDSRYRPASGQRPVPRCPVRSGASECWSSRCSILVLLTSVILKSQRRASESVKQELFCAFKAIHQRHKDACLDLALLYDTKHAALNQREIQLLLYYRWWSTDMDFFYANILERKVADIKLIYVISYFLIKRYACIMIASMYNCFTHLIN